MVPDRLLSIPSIVYHVQLKGERLNYKKTLNYRETLGGKERLEQPAPSQAAAAP